MTLDDFRKSLTAAGPPAGLSLALAGLWWEAKGDWARAHESAQQDEGPDGSWVHAYLHRKEGDESNAGYWYSRAGRPVCREPLDAEWESILRDILGREAYNFRLDKGVDMTLSEVGDLILAPDVEILRRGAYVNRRGARGYFVQIKCGNHWCKVSVSHADRHSARIAVGELDGIDSAMLQPTLVVPNSSISCALKSRLAESTDISTYLNSAGVEGIWAAFHYEGNWYQWPGV